MNTDILTAYQKEDTKMKVLKQSYLSISPPIRGDGATQNAKQVNNINQVQNDNYDTSPFNFADTFYSDDLSSLQNKRKINLYREILRYPEVDNIVNQIVADAIVYDDNKRFVYLKLDRTNFSPKIKERILEEFDEILRLYRSNKEMMRLFKRFYVDSKIFFHKIIDPDNPEEGIKELRELDPRNVLLHRENLYTTNEFGMEVWVGYNDYFLYERPIINNQLGFDFTQTASGNGAKYKIPRMAITYAHSGLTDCNDQIIGHLHKAIKPAHTLKMLEDAMVIYRVTRSPDRKIFYIDTGNLTPHQAKEMMDRVRREHSSKTVYDTETGKFDTYKNQLLVTDDYWLQRQNGKANAEITTLPGASGMNEIDDIKWHNKKLYEALNVPLSRMPNENAVNVFGDDGGTSRDERIFQKFIKQCRERFSEIFSDPLMTNLILKGVITREEWEENADSLIFNYNNDEYYTELANIELKSKRFDLVSIAEGFRGKYISGKRIMKDILQYSDEELEEIRKEIEEEEKDPIYNPSIKLDKYGQVINTVDLGTRSDEVEYIVPPEDEAEVEAEVESKEDEELEENLFEFNIYK